jgi:hypothetical protein
MRIGLFKSEISNLCSYVLIGGSILGCNGRGSEVARRGHYGPTDPIHRVVADVNANAEQIPTLRGAGSFEAWIADPDTNKTHFVNGEVTLLYSRPQSLRLIGKKDIAGQVFEIGSNDERYWVIVRGEQDTMWWGSYANLDRVDPKEIPVRPDLVLEVLGVQSIATDLLRQPAPVMRFNNDADAYMLVWNVQLPDRWAAQKEIWYDRQTKLPTLVLLFDENGRIVLRAYLSKHRPIEIEGVPSQEAPKVATSYRLFFPDTGSRMTIDLDDVALKRNNAPNERSFTFPAGERAGVSRIVAIDEQ